MAATQSKPITIAVAASFGALAVVLTLLPSLPFPIIPYLKFDIAEIPVVVAFLGFGPIIGITTSLIYWAILTMVGEFTPLGPFLKFIAVMSMLVGMWLGSRVYSLVGRGGMASFLAQLMLFGAVIRIAVMTVVNYLVLAVFFPYFLEFASSAVALSTGIQATSQLEALLLVLAFTAVFNAIHTALSLLPSAALVRKISQEGVFLRLTETWMLRILLRR